MGDPAWKYFEWQYQRLIHSYLTDKWYILQSGSDPNTELLWREVMEVLELDKKARRDLFLLAQSGRVGRCHANKLLWDLLSGPALDPRHTDMSNWTSKQVHKVRKIFDRPPRNHEDLKHFYWDRLDNVYETPLKPFLATAVPAGGTWVLAMGTGPDGGRPLPPPDCWGQRR